MPITLGTDPVDNARVVSFYDKHFPKVKPDRLIEQIVTRFDFQNRRFKDQQALFLAIFDAVAEEALEIDLDGFKAIKPIHAQFKQLMIGTVGPYELVKMTPKEMSLEQLAGEAQMLEVLRQAGLRTVPVYSTPEQVRSRGVMIERAIKGNLLDAKEGFSRRQNVNLIAALLGIEGINTESGNLAGLEKRIELAMVKGDLPSIAAIQTTIDDFTAIQTYQAHTVISDLQGILEFRTGKFFIIDPLALVPIAEKRVAEDGIIAYVNEVLRMLGNFKLHIDQQLAEKRKMLQTSQLTTIPKIPGPPH